MHSFLIQEIQHCLVLEHREVIAALFHTFLVFFMQAAGFSLTILSKEVVDEFSSHPFSSTALERDQCQFELLLQDLISQEIK